MVLDENHYTTYSRKKIKKEKLLYNLPLRFCCEIVVELSNHRSKNKESK